MKRTWEKEVCRGVLVFIRVYFISGHDAHTHTHYTAKKYIAARRDIREKVSVIITDSTRDVIKTTGKKGTGKKISLERANIKKVNSRGTRKGTG